MINRISFYFFLLLTGSFRLFPFWLIYLFSDFLSFILFRLVKYRSSVIDKNLQKCFPEKDRKELRKIKYKFYQNLCDILLETMKGYSLSREQVLKRYKTYGTELCDAHFEQGKDIIVVTGHFANWEWAGVPLAYYYKHRPIVLYKPISNPYIDKYIRDKRIEFGVDLAPINRTREYFEKKNDKRMAYYMIADQYYPNTNRQIKVDFFGSKTGFLDGPEKYARLHNIPVLYVEIKREKRGHYSLRNYEIAADPQCVEKDAITGMYAQLLEQTIKAQPEVWMWSHKRWKRELYSFE
jgi:Kdo2-lipid IVA lauroyltransferase/acyltransferase